MFVILFVLPSSPFWLSVDRLFDDLTPIQFDSSLKSKGEQKFETPNSFIEYMRI